MIEESNATIIGTGSFLPERVLTNFDLEKMVDTSDEWIFTRTGIRERRIADDDMATSDMASEAARRALENAGVAPEEVNLVLCATITPDYACLPATANVIQHAIGATNAGACDIATACSGFVYSVHLAAGHIKAHPGDTVLVVGAETLSRVTNWKDRSSCILFGDGAGAVVMRMGEPGQGLLGGELGSDGSGAEMMVNYAGGSREPASHDTVENDRHYMIVRGREVYKFAVTKMGDLMANAVESAGLTPDDVALVVPHQVNIRIITAAAERINLPMEKIVLNIERYGNTSAASVPIALNEANRQGRIKRGDVIILLGFGGGLSWASAVLRW